MRRGGWLGAALIGTIALSAAGETADVKKEANSVGVGFMPAIAPGYNDTAVRPGYPGRARYFADVENSAEGVIFRSMIRDVAVPNLDVKAANILMVTSFNEWYADRLNQQRESLNRVQPIPQTAGRITPVVKNTTIMNIFTTIY